MKFSENFTQAARPSSYLFRNTGCETGGTRVAASSGALAQLGERLICIQEVIGSIPIGSTMDLTGFDPLRTGPGW